MLQTLPAQEYIAGADAANANWEMFIDSMLNAYTPGIASHAATAGCRAGQQQTDLLICTTIAVRSTMDAGEGETEVLVNGNETAPNAVIPVALYLPGSGHAVRSMQPRWYSPQFEFDRMMVQGDNGAATTAEAPFSLPTPPTVGKASAACTCLAPALLGSAPFSLSLPSAGCSNELSSCGDSGSTIHTRQCIPKQAWRCGRKGWVRCS